MTEKKGTDLGAFYRKYEKNIVQFGLIFVMSIAIINPIGLPLPITEHPRNMYNYINTFGPETKVIWSCDITIAALGDQLPGNIAVVHHLLERGVQLFIVGFNVDGINMVLEPYILSEANPEDYGYVYGEDWVNLGYIAGQWTTAGYTFAEEIRKAVNYDKYGTPIDDLEIMEGVESLADFDVVLTTGSDYQATTISVWTDPYQKPFITFGSTAGVISQYAVFFKSGQLKEYVGGLIPGAEYEKLVGKPGKALATVDAVSFTHIFLLTFIVAGNIWYFKERLG